MCHTRLTTGRKLLKASGTKSQHVRADPNAALKGTNRMALFTGQIRICHVSQSQPVVTVAVLIASGVFVINTKIYD